MDQCVPIETARAAASASPMGTADHGFMLLAYNDSPFLAGCLASLTAQTTQSRITVATSTPSAAIERAAAAAGVPVLINPRRQGIAADWNFALEHAGTRYVTLAHQDDLYAPAFAARTLSLFAGHPEGALCFTGYEEIDELGRRRRSKLSTVKHLIERATLGGTETPGTLRCRAFLAFGDPLPCSSVTFDRHRLQNFRFSDAYAATLDWDAWWRLLQDGNRFLRAPERLIGRRHNALTETSRLIRAGVRRVEDLAMFQRIWPRPIGQALALLYCSGY